MSQNKRKFFGHSNRKLHDKQGLKDKKALGKRVVFLEENPFSARDRGEWDTEYQAGDFVSDDRPADAVRIRYKPREVEAYFVESDRFPDEYHLKRKRESGWFVPDLISGTTMFYVSRERFEELFEIVEGERR